MLITKIIGGLGNQMFQYAVAKSLAIQRNDIFKIDISAFSGYSQHQGFELNKIFGNIAVVAQRSDMSHILGWQSIPWVSRCFTHPYLSIFRSNLFIQEPGFDYWSEIKSIPENSYLSGYWQSEFYFKEYAEIIRNDFSFIIPMSKESLSIADEIMSCNAVSLHVRRGDYVTNSSANAFHGTCSVAYYNAAISYIIERVENPNFYIFSDDINWVKSNLALPHKTIYVEHNRGAYSYCDMQLMSLCKHHIIANSSFSWWGAWLNPNKAKIVIAPEKWFSLLPTPVGLLPDEWIKF